MRGLRALGKVRGRERKRPRDAIADAVVGAQAERGGGRQTQDGADREER